MLFTEKMRKIEIHVLKRDLDDVLRFLGSAGCIQLIAENRESREPGAEERQTAEMKVKLEALARFLGMESAPAPDGQGKAVDRPAVWQEARQLIDDTKDLVEEESRLVQKRLTLKQAGLQLAGFSRLKVSFDELDRLTYLVVRAGYVAPERVEELAGKLERRALLVPMATPGHIVAVATRKSRWALDSELKKAEFQESRFPEGFSGVPGDVLAGIHESLAEAERGLESVEERKRQLREARGDRILSLLGELELDVSADVVKQGLPASGAAIRVSGWVPTRRFPEVAAGLERITGGRLALRAFEPEEMPEVRSGKLKVPVSIRHGRVVGSFERMVFSYAVPLYGTIDPTPFVAVMFVLLFAIMFGDLGQGFVGLLLGLLIQSGWVKSFESYRRKSFGIVFILVGIASMIAGVLYGSFFANEESLIPVSRAITGAVFGAPRDHIVSLGTSGGFQKIMVFFGVTIGLGAVINSVGIVINIANALRRGDWEEGFLSKTGLAGGIFFWYAISLAVRILLGGRLSSIDFAILLIPLLCLFLRELIARAAHRQRPLLKDGVFAFVMEGFVEVLESAMYYLSNSVSFLRVAAFALAHAVLSSIVFLLADLVGSAPGGLAFRIAVVLIGNLIIIVLEGLVVTIQVIRLQYYEFFSKFFVRTGEEFRPFTLSTSGGLR